jgi:hypothetical protein
MMCCVPGRESLVEDGRTKYTYVPLQNSILGMTPDHNAVCEHCLAYHTYMLHRVGTRSM